MLNAIVQVRDGEIRESGRGEREGTGCKNEWAREMRGILIYLAGVTVKTCVDSACNSCTTVSHDTSQCELGGNLRYSSVKYPNYSFCYFSPLPPSPLPSSVLCILQQKKVFDEMIYIRANKDGICRSPYLSTTLPRLVCFVSLLFLLLLFLGLFPFMF